LVTVAPWAVPRTKTAAARHCGNLLIYLNSSVINELESYNYQRFASTAILSMLVVLLIRQGCLQIATAGWCPIALHDLAWIQ
jgi:hypothetical protein